MFLYYPSRVLWSENKMSWTNKLPNILKDIFLIDLLAADKECNNLVDEFNNTEVYMIDFIDKWIIKITWLVGLIWAHNCCDFYSGIPMIYHDV